MRTFFHEHLTPFRWGIVALFAMSQVVVLAWLWDGMGGSLGPLNSGYQMTAALTDGHSLQHAADVRIDGVTVGRVREISLTDDNFAQVRFQIDDESVLPMREGMTILPRVKSLLDDVYLEITPGPAGAPALPAGSTLEVENSRQRVQLDQVLGDLDADAIADAETLLGDLGEGFGGRAGELNDLATALGPLGDHGRQLFATLVETQGDLERVIDDTAVLLDVLDERDAQLVSLIDDGAALAAATARQDEAIVRTVEALPSTIEQLRSSSSSVVTLADELEPVARDLSVAAPDLNGVLEDLGPTATDLTAALPDLESVLGELPPLLDTFPDASEQVLALLGPAPEVLSHLNPSVRYLAPYAPELASFFSTWGDAFSARDANGHYLRLTLPVVGLETVAEQPITTIRSNAYPKPGRLGVLEEFTGEFPVIEPDPIPGRPTPERRGTPGTTEGNVIDRLLASLQDAAEPVLSLRYGEEGEVTDGLQPPGSAAEGPDDADDELNAALARTSPAVPPSRAPWLVFASLLVAAVAWYTSAETYRLHRQQVRLVAWEARGWRRGGT